MKTDSARDLGIIFEYLTVSMSHHTSSVSKSCFSSIRDLRRIRNSLDFTTAHTNCHVLSFTQNSTILQLSMFESSQSQLKSPPSHSNYTAQAVSKTPKFRTLLQFSNISNGSKLFNPTNVGLLISMTCFAFSATETPAHLILLFSNVIPFATVRNY